MILPTETINLNHNFVICGTAETGVINKYLRENDGDSYDVLISTSPFG